MRQASPAMSGRPPGTPIPFETRAMTSEDDHRQADVWSGEALQGTRREHTRRMEEATLTHSGAEPDGQRGDIGSLHGEGVPTR